MSVVAPAPKRLSIATERSVKGNTAVAAILGVG
jgi:hypothetical protein